MIIRSRSVDIHSCRRKLLNNRQLLCQLSRCAPVVLGIGFESIHGVSNGLSTFEAANVKQCITFVYDW